MEQRGLGVVVMRVGSLVAPHLVHTATGTRKPSAPTPKAWHHTLPRSPSPALLTAAPAAAFLPWDGGGGGGLIRSWR